MTEVLTLAHHIAGHDVDAPAALEQRNPHAPDDLNVQLPDGSASDVEAAAVAAHAAQRKLASGGIEARADALVRIARALVADLEPMALLIARETGKTLRDARMETMRAARIFEFFAGEALRIVGERYESTRNGAMVEVMHSPLGTVGLITPWNFPIAIPAWKIAPALAFGNAVVWKPSEVSSATAARLMSHIAVAGLPAGSVNMVLGAATAGAAISAHGGIDAVSFTGSEATGARVRQAVAARNGRMQLEMGGVNGLIVLADANLDIAVDCAINGAYFAAGQRCTATSRIIVEEAIAGRFIGAVRQKLQALRFGDPRDAATDIGPLANPRQKQRLMAQIEALRAEGAALAIGGTLSQDEDCHVPPMLFDDLDNRSLLAREEIFGPVAGLFRVPDFEHALETLNDSRYGLSAGLCTSSLRHAETFKRGARAGMLMVNLPTAGVDYHAPFGGEGASSHGPREQGRAARAFYTTLRTTYQHPG
jgi:acyl-CoA reductase-like NAD-dependent aldehyde dehydrogenase